ncbi:MAG TPA: hypothetical protein P5234_03450 [Thermoanaerobaculaceae bacterium]|nr:hypothetical protein [Thermoanaerobaculaceae bacterium]HRS15287.1 hypothetical protein [Thermoanaerobaculaceae bacterium]
MLVAMRWALAASVILAAALAGGEELFIPMVGQKQGQDGTWWSTEVWFVNTASTTGGYAVVFLPGGQANVEGLQAEPPLDDIPPGTTVYRNDLVPGGATGVLRVLTTDGVLAFGRIFSAAGRGSFGQGIPALPRSAALRPGEVGHLVGLRRTPQFRTNLAIFNPGPEPGTARVRLVLARGEVAGEEVFRLAGGGYLQLDDALHAFGLARAEHVRAEITGTVQLLVMASVIDTRSGAPTLVPLQR